MPATRHRPAGLGYDDEKLRRLCQEAIDAGFNHVKMKVGRDLEDDIRRLRIAREVIGPDRYLMIDANQVWEVDEAIDWVNKLAFAKPFFIEEPTSPDDVAGHRKIRAASVPSRSRPARCARTASCSSSSLPKAQSISSRSIHAAWAG
jgi:L-alanine-DL-glutamate epimerase-like enolase superfamily enzyme